MSGNEGLRRIARVIAGIGWIWGALMILLALLNTISEHGDRFFAVLTAISGIIGLGAAKAIAWIIRGFAMSRR